ncbi:OmpP1/FadL family transporter [Roseovarius sp.]|uniref:OmpP1/FadL family transporter n=1 Tax=Roseovarius sp. TaxID=1486281 RepID=UPI003BA8D1C9
MQKLTSTAAVLALSAGTATAGGLDRSYTPIDQIFEQGSFAEVSYGFTMPDLTGVDFGGNAIGNVGNDFGVLGSAVKLDFGDRLTFAVIADQPYGADTVYGGNPATTFLGGTFAKADTASLTAILKYKITDRFSVYGGPRAVKADGTIRLSGQAYAAAGLSGYTVRFRSNNGTGYVIGAAYEIPEYALRVSGTYHSAVDLRMGTVENIPVTAGGTGTPVGTGITNVEIPQSFELAAQSGINKNTLVFGSIRWADWEAFTLNPPSPVPNLAQLDSVTTYEIGVGRRFSERFSGSVAVSYEAGGSDSLVSPLAPTNGQTAISVGGKYKVTDRIDISGGVRYTWLGDALPEIGTPDTPVGSFTNNNAVSVGLKVRVALN